MPIVNQILPIWEWPRHEEYDCSVIHPPGDWWTKEYGVAQPVFGWWFISWGVVCKVIMLWLAVIDIIAIFSNSIFFGILLIKGYVFCTDPWFVWMVGCIGLGMWCDASINCLLLVTNRLFELLNYAHFSQARTTRYLFLTSVYMFYFTFLTPPIFTNSKEKGMFLDPFIGPANLEKIFTQATLICVFNVVASLEYVYMNFFPATPTLVEIGHLCWQLSHGAPPYIYLLLNKTEQERCRKSRKLLGIRRVKINTITATQTDTSSHQVPSSQAFVM